MVRVEWFPDHPNILLQTVPPIWTVQDLIDSAHEITAYFQQEPETRTDLICDITASQVLPPGVVSATPYMSNLLHPGSRVIVIVGLKNFEVQLLHALRKQISPLRKRIQLAETVPEAVELILASRA